MVERARAVLPDIAGATVRPVPCEFGDWIEVQVVSSERVRDAVAWASENPRRSNLASALEKQFEDDHRVIMESDGTNCPEVEETDTRCWRIGCCICQPRTRPLAQKVNRFLNILKCVCPAGAPERHLLRDGMLAFQMAAWFPPEAGHGHAVILPRSNTCKQSLPMLLL